MKKTSLLLIFASLALFLSCSSDDNENTTSLFKVSIDGNEFISTTITAISHDGIVEIAAQNDSNERIDLAFSEEGFLMSFSYLNTSNFSNYRFLYYNPSRSSEFSLSSLSGNSATGTFSGKLYVDDIDISSDFITLSDGIFNNIELTTINDITDTPNYLNGNVNGNYWEAINISHSISSTSSSAGGPGFDEKIIDIQIPSDITPGSYNYTDTSALKVIYDVYEEYPIDDFSYTNSGSITITEVVNLSPFSQLYVTGTFNHTATESLGEIVTVSNGKFGLVVEF